MMSCCEYHSNVTCNQGRNCPARNSVCAITAFYAEVEGVLPMVDDCHKVERVPFPALDGVEPAEAATFDPAEFSYLEKGEWCGVCFVAVVCLAGWASAAIAAFNRFAPVFPL